MQAQISTAEMSWAGGTLGSLPGLDLVLSRLSLATGVSVRRADSQLIGELFNQHGARVFRRAQRLLGNAADAEEATQEVFIRAIRGMDSFERRSQLTTWLYQITTNYCLNLLRDGGRRADLIQEHVAPAVASQGDSASPRADDLSLVRSLLAAADPQQAQAAVYVYLDGMTHEEAAALLGVSKRTVGNLLDRFGAWARERSGEGDDAAPVPVAGRGES